MGTSSAVHEGELTGLEPGPLGWVRTALIKVVLKVEPAKCSYEPAAIQSSNGMDVFGYMLGTHVARKYVLFCQFR